MKFFFILAIALLIFGICGLFGGLLMLSVGYWVSRIDAFSVTPFQAAAICVGFAIVSSIIVNQLMSALLFPPFYIWNGEEKDKKSSSTSKRQRKKS